MKKEKPTSIFIPVRVPPELHAKLKVALACQRTTFQEVAVKAFEEFLKRFREENQEEIHQIFG